MFQQEAVSISRFLIYFWLWAVSWWGCHENKSTEIRCTLRCSWWRNLFWSWVTLPMPWHSPPSALRIPASSSAAPTPNRILIPQSLWCTSFPQQTSGPGLLPAVPSPATCLWHMPHFCGFQWSSRPCHLLGWVAPPSLLGTCPGTPLPKSGSLYHVDLSTFLIYFDCSERVCFS